VLDDLERVTRENRDLRRELDAKLRLNRQLIDELVIFQKELELFLRTSRFRIAMNGAKPIDKVAVINFPKQDFTIEELVAANPGIVREEVVLHLAHRLALREVGFFPRSQYNEPASPFSGGGKPLSFIYRINA